MKFAESLIYFRERAGLNKTELADKIGLSLQYIGDIENKRKKPPVPEVTEKISTVLDLSDDEKADLIQKAIEERRSPTENKYLEMLSNISSSDFAINHSLTEKLKSMNKVPLIDFVHASQFHDINDPFPVGCGSEYIMTTEKGKHVFALTVQNNCMEPEFLEGDVIIVNPEKQVMNNDFCIVADRKENTSTFKQYKQYGDNIILRPLNPNCDDIKFDCEEIEFKEENERFVIVGKVVEKFKKY